MKKKWICILFAALFAAVGIGCGGGDVTVSFSPLPWANTELGDPLQEETVYKVERIYVGGKTDIVVAEGEYKSVLRPGKSGESVITNEFTLTYNDDPHTSWTDSAGARVISRGCTDSYTATVVCNSDNLSPVSAVKEQNVEQRALCLVNDVPFTPVEKITEALPEDVAFRYELPEKQRYADPRGYSYAANYTEGTVAFTTTEGTTDKQNGKYYRDYKAVENTYNIKNNTRYDNEQLNYVVRALSGCKRKGSGTFYLSNFYDTYTRDKYVRHTMKLSCQSKTADTTLELDPALITVCGVDGDLNKIDKDGANDASNIDTTAKYTVPCVQASVSLSSSSSGPSIEMLITDPAYTVAQRTSPNVRTNKLLVRMQYTEYGYSAKREFITVYTLKSFRNRFDNTQN